LRRGPEAELLSREATTAIDTAFNTLAQTVKKHEPSLEDVVRETLRPLLMARPKLAELGQADGAGGNRASGSRALIT
jgi:Protein of unknown function (DUF2497)